MRKRCLCISGIFLLGLLLSGCPKKFVKIPPIETLPVENPVAKLLEAFSAAETVQARAAIRIDTVRKGEEVSFLLNGTLFYQKPDKLRILGYHPLGMGLFDALYRNGEFFLLSPLQKKAFTGEVSEFDDLIAKAGIQISTEKAPGYLIPNLIRIAVEEKETRIDLKIKEPSINSSLPEDAFRWEVPEGVEVMSLAQLLKGKKL